MTCNVTCPLLMTHLVCHLYYMPAVARLCWSIDQGVSSAGHGCSVHPLGLESHPACKQGRLGPGGCSKSVASQLLCLCFSSLGQLVGFASVVLSLGARFIFLFFLQAWFYASGLISSISMSVDQDLHWECLGFLLE